MHKTRRRRLRRAHQLLVTPNPRLKAKRTPMRSKAQPSRPHAWWGIDMTKGLVQGFGWLDIGLVLDWYTKAIVGDAAGMQSQARDWRTALDLAVNGQVPAGVCGQGRALMRDNGCQPTSTVFMGACGTLEFSTRLPAITIPRAMRILSGSCGP
jgi:putative transposase